MTDYIYSTKDGSVKLTLSPNGDLTILRLGRTSGRIQIEGSGFWLWDTLVGQLARPNTLDPALHEITWALKRRVHEARGAECVRKAWVEAAICGQTGTAWADTSGED